jgi:hypothetical protein
MIILLFKTPPSNSTQGLSCWSLCPSQHSPCRSSCALFAWRYGRVRKCWDKNFASLFSHALSLSCRVASPLCRPTVYHNAFQVSVWSKDVQIMEIAQALGTILLAFVASISRYFIEKPPKDCVELVLQITQCGILGVTTLLCFNLSLPVPDPLFSRRLSCIPSIWLPMLSPSPYVPLSLSTLVVSIPSIIHVVIWLFCHIHCQQGKASLHLPSVLHSDSKEWIWIQHVVSDQNYWLLFPMWTQKSSLARLINYTMSFNNMDKYVVGAHFEYAQGEQRRHCSAIMIK